MITPLLALSILAGATCTYPGTQGKVADYYTGPLIDTHLHIPSPEDSDNGNPVLWQDLSLKDIACTLKQEGTESAFAFFPIYVGSPLDEFYLAAERAQAKYPDLFVRFINPPGNQSGVPTVTANRLKKLLKDHDGLFQGYGEIALYGHDGEAVNPYHPNAEIFLEIYTVANKRQMLVYFHPGVDQLDSFAEVLAQYPNINFVVHGEQIEQEVGDLMDVYPNIYFTVNDLYGDQYLLHQNETSAGFLEKTEDYETLLQQDLATWQAVIEAHPNQFLWGTDRGGVAAWTLNKKVGRRIADYGRAFIARLDPAVQENFAYKNAQALIDSTD
ncbi:MAG: amidohydrolase family protein [Candidatus Kerfeldbacteria bacterium]|nr:amidohydrolase family protein [Candidatus Kerfeldbacteria bacterium]